MPRYIEENWLLDKAVPHGWSTPKWVSDIVIKDAPASAAIEIVRCKDCKHRPYKDEDGDVYEPDWGDYTCPFLCEDSYYNGMPEDDFFCKRGERREDD